MREIIESYAAEPSTNIITVMAHSGYTLESAIADIVDNSLRVNPKRIDINFHREGANSFVEITDDGEGMNEEDLKHSIIYAYKSIEDERSAEDIGRYSVGLNTASSSFCGDLFVTSKQKDARPHCVEMPFYKKEWKANVIFCDENAIKTQSGTVVRWEKLKFVKDEEKNKELFENPTAWAKRVTGVKKHLSKVFCFYMKREKNPVKFYVNGVQLQPWDPFGTKGTQSNLNEKFVLCGQTIEITNYLLPTKSTLSPEDLDYASEGDPDGFAGKQGFYFYRNDRLIQGGTWMNLFNSSEENQYSRIKIDFKASQKIDSLLSLNFIKNSISLPDELAEKLKKCGKKGCTDSKKQRLTHKIGRLTKKTKQLNHSAVWTVTRYDQSVKIEINPEHPLIKEYTKNVPPSDLKKLFSLINKDIPTREYTTLQPKIEELSDSELRTLIDDALERYSREGLSIKEASRKVLSTEPFSDQKYKTKAVTYLLDKMKEEEEHE